MRCAFILLFSFVFIAFLGEAQNDGTLGVPSSSTGVVSEPSPVQSDGDDPVGDVDPPSEQPPDEEDPSIIDESETETPSGEDPKPIDESETGPPSDEEDPKPIDESETGPPSGEDPKTIDESETVSPSDTESSTLEDDDDPDLFAELNTDPNADRNIVVPAQTGEETAPLGDPQVPQTSNNIDVESVVVDSGEGTQETTSEAEPIPVNDDPGTVVDGEPVSPEEVPVPRSGLNLGKQGSGISLSALSDGSSLEVPLRYVVLSGIAAMLALF